MNEALIILGDQLFPVKFYHSHQKKLVFMAEDVGLCTHYKYHKHKIAFFLTAMRKYADELRSKSFDVHYEELSREPYVTRLKRFLKTQGIQKVTMVEIQDKFFEQELESLFKEQDIVVEFLESPMFLCSRQEFKNYLYYNPKPFMKTFYERERKRQKIMIDAKGKPFGGHWSYDVENRKRVPKELTCKEQNIRQDTSHFPAVRALVEKHFSDHPGNLDEFWMPTDRKGALSSLQHFLKHNLVHFGDYQDAITARAPFLYHSVISPMVNAGLLTPSDIVIKVLKARDENPEIPLAAVEGFIRQLMGWREFVRGIYRNFSEEEESRNFFMHKRKLTRDWYEGTTGIKPVDDCIKKANQYGYCHHIERLMVLSNFMLLAEIDPREVHKWFMEMFVDSADWVMGPNVYGMGQFSDGGIFATKPYISGSNYILKMSDYKKEDWCETWDALFWRFIGKHKDFFSKNPRLSMMARTYEKMDEVRKKRLEAAAEEFLETKTAKPGLKRVS